MAEYIKREAVIDLITRRYENPEICTHEINSIPAADVAPVVLGRWIPFHSKISGDIQYCSACEIGFVAKSDYCPHCGAKMDGGAESIEREAAVKLAGKYGLAICNYGEQE